MKRKLLLIVLLAFVLGGCNWMAFGYKWADRLILFKVDRYFDLTDTQETALKAQIETTLTWHRTTQLPLYIDFVTQVEEAVKPSPNPSLTSAKLAAIFSRWGELREALLTKLAAPSAAFLASTTADQRDLFRAKLGQENQGLLEELKQSEAKRRSERKKWLKETIEDWAGRLNRKQVETLKAFTAEIPLQDEQWLTSRLGRQDYFFRRLNRGPEATLPEFLVDLWVVSYRPQNTPVGERQREIRARYQQLLLDLYNLMSPEQVQELLKRLGDLKETLADLAEG